MFEQINNQSINQPLSGVYKFVQHSLIPHQTVA